MSIELSVELNSELSSELKLRQMQAPDAEDVASLQAELDFSNWNSSQWVEALGHYPCAWVIENASTIIGYVIYQTRVPQVELLNIGITADHQGQGLAMSLLLSTIKLLPENSESIFLEVRRSNIPAIGLYEKAGFIKVGERRDYYPVAGGTREDALIYKHDLSAC